MLKILFIYSWETEREREAETQAEGEACSMPGAQRRTQSPDSRIAPWAKGRRQTAEPPRNPPCTELCSLYQARQVEGSKCWKWGLFFCPGCRKEREFLRKVILTDAEWGQDKVNRWWGWSEQRLKLEYSGERGRLGTGDQRPRSQTWLSPTLVVNWPCWHSMKIHRGSQDIWAVSWPSVKIFLMDHFVIKELLSEGGLMTYHCLPRIWGGLEV